MALYKLVFKKSVSRDLRSIPNKDVTRTLQRIEELQQNPRPVGSEKLSGQERYRVRQVSNGVATSIDPKHVFDALAEIK